MDLHLVGPLPEAFRLCMVDLILVQMMFVLVTAERSAVSSQLLRCCGFLHGSANGAFACCHPGRTVLQEQHMLLPGHCAFDEHLMMPEHVKISEPLSIG